ncbi:MAG: cellulase family glycosylhydrolase [Rhodothermales bacterium]|nr:cellulase family glycosylhydrolase [Rhodothermales bacterium]
MKHSQTQAKWLVPLILLLLVVGSRPAKSQTEGFYRTDGKEILDPSGMPVLFKGVGLGGWLVPEGYMLHIAAPDGGSPTSIRSQIEDLIGSEDTKTFYDMYRANYVAEKDIAAIAEWGFDNIRLPFHYKLLYDPVTESFIEEGFDLVDQFLEWCRTYGLSVILDMHAAPGAQNDGNISDSDGEARLWTEPVPYQDQAVEIWREIASRYVNEPLIVGYDLINEPVTPDGVSGDDLRALYERITEAIREVDENHIVFIEGNFYATHFPELLPPFDSNMVYTFHKYWNGTAVNSIQYLLDIREDHNTPLWLGETGENSNVWFHDVVQLMKEHRIGWNIWTHKKIETTTSPLSSPFAPGYERVLDYWRGNATKPTAEFARDALFAMAEGLDLDSSDTRPGVLASLLDSTYRFLRVPFRDHVIPGTINAVDYDIGNQFTTYFDSDVSATTGTPGGGNNGTKYRNDGVDIETSTDPLGYKYNVGWTQTLEFLTYTVNVETSGIYDIDVRVASDVGGGAFQLLIDDVQLGSNVTVTDTGGWQNWITVSLEGIELTAGQHILKMAVRTGDFNINTYTFELITATSIDDESPSLDDRLVSIFPNPAVNAFEVEFLLQRPSAAGVEIFDMLGRRVHTEAPQAFQQGRHSVLLAPQLAAGVYLVQLSVGSSEDRRTFSKTVSVVP